MPVYKWVAETRKGRTIKGELEAANECRLYATQDHQ